MSKTKQPSIKSRLGNLSGDSVASKPIDIDWSEAFGEDCDGWTSYEGQTCEECGGIVVCSSGGGNADHAFLAEDDAVSCEGHIPSAEGPMMNYWYPLQISDCREAAKKIAHLPVCVVEMQDGQTGLALTGGGMDLSWQICEAFVLLGSLPPLHFAGRLDRMAGMTLDDTTRLILAAGEMSASVAAKWAAADLKRIRKLRRDIAEAEAKRKSASK